LIVIGRPVSAVCPWPWSSTAISCLLAAGFEQRPEIEIDGHQAAVEQYEWPAGAARLV
jgi:hypothetical protein